MSQQRGPTPRRTLPRRRVLAAAGIAAACAAAVTVSLVASASPDLAASTGATAGTAVARQAAQEAAQQASQRLVSEGQQTFRFDTFGDEAFWGGTLHLDQAIEGAAHGGVGPGLSPRTALGVGLKVDSAALPSTVKDAITSGQVDLDDPAVTLQLLKLNSVVGVKGVFDSSGNLRSVGIECALCHSTVDDSLAPGIGKRLDGWANRDLNVGAVVSLAPNLQPVASLLHTDVATVKKVLGAWGPGKFDAELFLDGKGFRLDGKTAATLIPPAFGLAGIDRHTYTGWGSVPYWNAFVANLEMHGQGNFYDERLDNAQKFPVAARNRMGHTRFNGDKIRYKLPALQAYQLSLRAPKPKSGTFNAAAARRGKAIFDGKGRCASCHMPPTYSEPGNNLHTPASICTDDFQAQRSPTNEYRTTPLGGLGTRTKGGYYHDGRYRTLGEVVQHYNSCFGLGLTGSEQSDVVEYLKSL